MKYLNCQEDTHVPHKCARDTPLKDQNHHEKWKPTDSKNASYQGDCVSDVKVLESETMGKEGRSYYL